MFAAGFSLHRVRAADIAEHRFFYAWFFRNQPALAWFMELWRVLALSSLWFSVSTISRIYQTGSSQYLNI